MHIDALPLDVLELILALLPAALRLRHASFTCKRWRTAALRATTSLADPVDFARAAQLLPCLERVRIASHPFTLPDDDVPLPALRSFTLSTDHEQEHERNLRRLVARTTLTRLELLDLVDIEVVNACAASLTAWCIFLSAVDHPLVSLSGRCDFPRLTSLEIGGNGILAANLSALRTLLRRTHTQLERVDVSLGGEDHMALWSELASLPLPHLTHLSARLVFNSVADLLVPVLAQCPPSVALSLTRRRTAAPLLNRLTPLASSLTHLQLAEIHYEPQPLVAFLASPSASRLTSLELGSSARLEWVARIPAAGSKLTSLVLDYDTPHVHLCPRLTSLRVLNPSLFFRPGVPILRSPLLLRLESAPVSLATLQAALRVCPHLRKLVAILHGPCAAEALCALADSHAHLEECRVRIEPQSDGPPGQRLVARRCVIHIIVTDE